MEPKEQVLVDYDGDSLELKNDNTHLQLNTTSPYGFRIETEEQRLAIIKFLGGSDGVPEEAKLKEAYEELETAKANAEVLHRVNEDHRKEKAILREELKKVKAANTELLDKNEKLNESIADLNAKWDADRDELIDEINMWREEASELQSRLGDVQFEKAELVKELKGFKSKPSKTPEQISDGLIAFKDLKINELRSELNEETETHTKTYNELQAAYQQIQELEGRLQVCREQRDQDAHAIATGDERLKAQEQELTDLKAKLEEEQKMRGESQADVRMLKLDLTQAENAIHNLNNRIQEDEISHIRVNDKYEKEVVALKQELYNSERYLDKYRDELMEANVTIRRLEAIHNQDSKLIGELRAERKKQMNW